MAGDDDDFRPSLAVELANVLQHIHAIAIGKPDVQQHRVVGGVTQQHHGLAAGGGRGDGVAVFA